MGDAPAADGNAAENPPPEGGGEEEADVPNQTIYENLMNTSVLPPWTAPEPEDAVEDDVPISQSVHAMPGQVISYTNLSRPGWKKRVDFAAKQQEMFRRNFIVAEHDPEYDLTHLLEITLSTIGLLAMGEAEIPETNFICTDVYLRSITTEHSEVPPNISGFLKYLEKEMEKRNIAFIKPVKLKPPPEIKVIHFPPPPTPVHVLNRKKMPLSRKEKAFHSKRRRFEGVADTSRRRVEDKYDQMIDEELSESAICRAPDTTQNVPEVVEIPDNPPNENEAEAPAAPEPGQ